MRADKDYPYDVFISYRWVTPDMEWVREELHPALVSAGLKVCLDVEDFIPGRDLILEMERAGADSRHVLCVISPEYFEEGRMAEFEALSARRRDPAGRYSSLIPLVVREARMPDRIGGLIPVDWMRPASRAREWRKLLRVLNAPNPQASPPPGIEADSHPPGEADRTGIGEGLAGDRAEEVVDSSASKAGADDGPTSLRTQRLRQELDQMQGLWELTKEKLGAFERALVIETGVAVRFQLEQQRREEEARLAEIAAKIDEIERALQ
jgi:TIR domain